MFVLTASVTEVNRHYREIHAVSIIVQEDIQILSYRDTLIPQHCTHS